MSHGSFVRLSRQPFELHSVISSVSSLFKLEAEKKNIALCTEIWQCMSEGQRDVIDSRHPVVLVGDSERLLQILVNLLGNAVKFTERGGVTLKAELGLLDPAIAKLVVTVKDTGIGISPQNVEKLFQPFMQADISSTRKYGGVGVGLAISKRLATMMGGKITIKSELGVGSVVTLEVPFASAESMTLSSHGV